MKSPERLGTAGENQLRIWAAEVGAVVNKAHVDRTGWDFLVEWESLTPPTPRDRRPGHYQALIQVKATGSTRGRRSVSLENWLRLCTTSLPVFFLIIEFDGLEPRRAFLRHVWEAEIKTTLRRVRETESSGEDLTGKTKSLTWGDSHSIKRSGESLFRELSDHVGESLSEYAQRKAKLLQEVGYEEGFQQALVSIQVPDGHSESDVDSLMADLHLGVISELETTGVEIWDVRFGIPATVPEATFDTKGRLEAPSGREGTLCLSHGDVECNVPGIAYVWQPPEKRGTLEEAYFRIVVAFLEITFQTNGSAGRIAFSLPDPDEQLRLGDLADGARISRFVFRSIQRSTGPCRMRLKFEDYGLGELSVEGGALPEELKELAETIERFWRLLERARLKDRDTVSLRLIESQRSAVDLLQHITSGGVPNGRLTFPLEPGRQANATIPVGTVAVPTLISLQTFDGLLVFPVVNYGAVEIVTTGGEDVIAVGVARSSLQEAVFFRNDDWPSREEWQSLMQEVGASEAVESYTVLEWWDFVPDDEPGNGPPPAGEMG